MTYADTLREIADSFDLDLSMPINQVPMRYTDNSQDNNSFLNLMFIYANAEKFNNHSILTNLCKPSDHASLSVHIFIKEKLIQEKKLTIVKNSKKEKEFINELRNRVSCINTTNILNCEKLEEVCQICEVWTLAFLFNFLFLFLFSFLFFSFLYCWI